MIAFSVVVISSKPDELTVRGMYSDEDFSLLLLTQNRLHRTTSPTCRKRSQRECTKRGLSPFRPLSLVVIGMRPRQKGSSEAATTDALREAELLKAKLELAKAATAVIPIKHKRIYSIQLEESQAACGDEAMMAEPERTAAEGYHAEDKGLLTTGLKYASIGGEVFFAVPYAYNIFTRD